MVQAVMATLYDRLSLADKLAIALPPNRTVLECEFMGVRRESCQELMGGMDRTISPKYGVCTSFNHFPKGKSEQCPASLDFGKL